VPDIGLRSQSGRQGMLARAGAENEDTHDAKL
jgi:hypothetical protein